MVSAVLLFNFMNSTSSAASLPEDCNNNSIIYCGGITPAILAQRYTANSTGDLPAIYSSYGLSSSDMTNAGSAAQMGQVNKDGTVVVNGAVVATNALTIGRQNIAGSTTKVIAGRTYYQRSPSVSFLSNSIAAYVFFDANGNFRAFVLTSCGNPGTATPVPPKPKPVYTCDSLAATKISRTEFSFGTQASASGGATISGYTYDFGDGQTVDSPNATMTHTYAQPGTYTAKVTVSVLVDGATQTTTSPACQTQVVIETPPPTPVYTCDSLAATQIDRTDYSFTGAATAEGGATISGYTFDFGDGTAPQQVTSPTNVTHTYANAGPYTVTMTVTVQVNGTQTTVTGPQCQTQVTVAEQECLPGVPVGSAQCTPPTTTTTPPTPTTPTELPHTGSSDVLFSSLGLGSIIASAYYWYSSRRGLLSALLSR